MVGYRYTNINIKHSGWLRVIIYYRWIIWWFLWILLPLPCNHRAVEQQPVVGRCEAACQDQQPLYDPGEPVTHPANRRKHWGMGLLSCWFYFIKIYYVLWGMVMILLRNIFLPNCIFKTSRYLLYHCKNSYWINFIPNKFWNNFRPLISHRMKCFHMVTFQMVTVCEVLPSSQLVLIIATFMASLPYWIWL